MTAEKESPEKGHERTGIDWKHKPLERASNEEIAMAIEEEKEQMRAACNTVTKALLNEEEPLTDEKVGEMDTYANHVKALVRTLTHRVPEEYRTEEKGEK